MPSWYAGIPRRRTVRSPAEEPSGRHRRAPGPSTGRVCFMGNRTAAAAFTAWRPISHTPRAWAAMLYAIVELRPVHAGRFRLVRTAAPCRRLYIAPASIPCRPVLRLRHRPQCSHARPRSIDGGAGRIGLIGEITQSAIARPQRDYRAHGYVYATWLKDRIGPSHSRINHLVRKRQPF
jgi:hypothetical protein